MQARLSLSTLAVMGVWVLLNLGSATYAFGPAAPSESNLRSAFTYDKVEALNFNLVQQVPLCAATNTRPQPSIMGASGQLCSTAGTPKLLGEASLRILLGLLNDPANFQANTTPSATAFEPHLAVLFRDAQRQVVLVVEISLISNTIRTQPRLADFTQQTLSAKGRSVISGICEGLGLTQVDANYASQYSPDRLNPTQRTALMAFAVNPALFGDMAMAQNNNTAEQRAAEQRAAEQRAAEQRAAEQRAAEQRAAEQRAAEQRAAEQRLAEQRAADQRAAEQRAAEQQAQQNQTAAAVDEDSDEDMALDIDAFETEDAEPEVEVGRRDARELERDEMANLDAALNMDDDLGGDMGLDELDDMGSFEEEDDFGDFDMDMDF